MWLWIDYLGILVLDASVSAVVLWGVAALAIRGNRQPARRLLIARAATLGSLSFLPIIGFDLVPQFDLFALFGESGEIFQPVRPAGEIVGASTGPGVGFVIWSARLLTLFYATAVSFSLGWLALGYAGLSRLIGGSCVASPETLAMLESLPYAGRRRPRLRVSARVRSPVLIGLSRPMILIPSDLDQPDARDRLRLALLHELAHAAAGDAWSGLICNLDKAFWFFVPPRWWVASRMRLDEEFLADRRASQGFGPSRAYAASLVDLAAVHAESEPARSASGRSPLFQRVLMLLRCPFPIESTPPVWWSRGLPCLALLITLAVSTLTVRFPSPNPAERSSTSSPDTRPEDTSNRRTDRYGPDEARSASTSPILPD